MNDWERKLTCLDGIAKPREEITITLPNGKEEKGTSWETTPLMIAKGISKSLLERTVITKVDGELWDLTRPFEKSCKLELIDFESEEGKNNRSVDWWRLLMCWYRQGCLLAFFRTYFGGGLRETVWLLSLQWAAYQGSSWFLL